MSSNGTCARFDISRRWEAFAPSVITMGELPTTAASVRDSSTRRSCIHSSAQLGRCVLDANATGTPRSASVESARRAPSKRRSVSPLEARMPPSPSSIDTHGGPLRKRGRAQSVQSRSQTTRVGSGVGRHESIMSFRCQSRAVAGNELGFARRVDVHTKMPFRKHNHRPRSPWRAQTSLRSTYSANTMARKLYVRSHEAPRPIKCA